MKCMGCYRDVDQGYCLRCRKKLFNGARVLPVLSFGSPKADNLEMYQQQSRGLSISGVQLKYSLALQNKFLHLTDQQGLFILKPVPTSKHLAYPEEVPKNEHLTMQIAAQVFDIVTAENALIEFNDGEKAYITRRFDVLDNGEKRLQEDFAQLTNRSKSTHGELYKYDGSYFEIGQLIRRYVAAAVPALEQFYKIIIFNYVFSNGDAHLRNFSLMRTETGEYTLTPAYDLISTVIHTPGEYDTALDLYEKDMDGPFYSSYGFYGKPEFLELAKRLGIIEKRAMLVIENFFSQRDLVKEFVMHSFLSDSLKELYIKRFADKLTKLEMTL